MAATGVTVTLLGQPPSQYVKSDYTFLRDIIKKDEGDWFKPGSEILMESPDRVLSAGEHRNGLVGAFEEAHKNNLGLIVSPDDVWLTLMIAYGNFLSVKENAERMRSTFVSHLGQAQLIIDVLGSELQDYQLILQLFADKISGNIKDPKIKEWVEPGFTTTKPYDKAISQVALMASLKHYFAYGVASLAMIGPMVPAPPPRKKGISWIHMKGTRDDWYKLGLKFNYLNELGVLSGVTELSTWAKALADIAWNFLMTYDNKPDLTWWESLSMSDIGKGGSNGWLSYFIPFEKGEWVVGKGYISREMYSSVHVPVKIKVIPGAGVPPVIRNKLASDGTMDTMIYAGVS